MIYADYASTTPVDSLVLDTMLPYFCDKFYNPSSIYPLGKEVLGSIDNVRQKILEVINASNGKIIFTSGGTESNNLAIKGAALHTNQKKKHIVTSSVEHHSVLDTCRFLETIGFEVTYLPVDCNGLVSPLSLENAIRNDTFLVSVMWVNNEIGSINNIRELAEISHKYGALFHTDAVQAMSTQLIDVDKFDIDLMTFSGHKIYAPKGSGALYCRNGVDILPLINGGQQEFFVRGGTENVPQIIGLGKAIELLHENITSSVENMIRQKSVFIDGIKNIEGVIINGGLENTVPSILNIGFRDIEGEAVIFYLSREGIQASMGAACNSKSVEPSHVISAIGVKPEYLRGSVRFSFGKFLTDEDVYTIVDKLKIIIKKIKV